MSFLTVPPPYDDDHEDVAWALRAASAQWKRDAHEDAVHWVRRASETAKELGAAMRANELSRLAVALTNASMTAVAPPPPPVLIVSSPPFAMAPPPPPGAMAPPPRAPAVVAHASGPVSVDFEIVDVDLELEEGDAIEELDDDDEIELLDDQGIEEVSDVMDATPPPGLSGGATAAAVSRGYNPVPPPSLPPVRARAVSSSPPRGNTSRHPGEKRGEARPAHPPPAFADTADQVAPSAPSVPPLSERPATRRSSAPASDSTERAARVSPRRPSSRSSARPQSSRPTSPQGRSTTATSKATHAEPADHNDSSRKGRTTTARKLDRLPPSMRPQPSGLDLEDEGESELSPEERSERARAGDEFGELSFSDEPKTNRLDSEVPPIPDLGPISLEGASVLPMEQQTAAEYAQRKGAAQHDHEALERELGVDLSVRGATRASYLPKTPAPSDNTGAFRVSSYPSSVPPGVVSGLPGLFGEEEIPELEVGTSSPVPGRAAARPSHDSVKAVPLQTSALHEPYGLAPSAALPPITTALGEGRIEPPSRPSYAPPPSSMAEPNHHYPSTQSASIVDVAYPDIPPTSAAPDPDEFEELFAKISIPPVAARTQTPPAQLDAPGFDGLDEPKGFDGSNEPNEDEPAPHSIPAAPLAGDDGSVLVDGLDLMEVNGFQDLPQDSALALAQRAELRTLRRHEEITGFGLAIVTHGAVMLMPSVADAACRVARQGEVLFTQGTLDNPTAVRVVGLEDGSRVAVFSKADLDRAVESCPWVGDELAEVADSHLAFAGAVLGPLGHSLDEMFRFMVLEKCTVKRRVPGDVIATGGKPMDGMYVVGGGSLVEVDERGAIVQELAVGDFVFPETVLSAAPAKHTVKAGAAGALVLFAPRRSAHELLATCPPFIELLAR